MYSTPHAHTSFLPCPLHACQAQSDCLVRMLRAQRMEAEAQERAARAVGRGAQGQAEDDDINIVGAGVATSVGLAPANTPLH